MNATTITRPACKTAVRKIEAKKTIESDSLSGDCLGKVSRGCESCKSKFHKNRNTKSNTVQKVKRRRRDFEGTIDF